MELTFNPHNTFDSSICAVAKPLHWVTCSPRSLSLSLSACLAFTPFDLSKENKWFLMPSSARLYRSDNSGSSPNVRDLFWKTSQISAEFVMFVRIRMPTATIIGNLYSSSSTASWPRSMPLSLPKAAQLSAIQRWYCASPELWLIHGHLSCTSNSSGRCRIFPSFRSLFVVHHCLQHLPTTIIKYASLP